MGRVGCSWTSSDSVETRCAFAASSSPSSHSREVHKFPKVHKFPRDRAHSGDQHGMLCRIPLEVASSREVHKFPRGRPQHLQEGDQHGARCQYPWKSHLPEKCTNFLGAELQKVISTDAGCRYPWKSYLPEKCSIFQKARLKKVISTVQAANALGCRIFPRSA